MSLTPDPPYKGLLAYSECDAHYFFGRLRETQTILENLIAWRVTVLYGASGAGKSSVLQAGVAHRIHADSVSDRAAGFVPDFELVYFRNWRDDPLAALERALSAVVPLPGTNGGDLIDHLEAAFGESPLGDRRFPNKLLVILDQFEEYFVYHPQPLRSGDFAHQLARAINNPRLRVNFLISLREDSLSKLDRFKGLIQTLFENRLQLERLETDAARSALTEPVNVYNERLASADPLVVEPTLVECVLEQVKTGRVQMTLGGRGVSKGVLGEERIEAAFLQIVILRVWEEEMKVGSRILRASTLERLGGAERIVADHLQRALGALTPEEEEAASRAFSYLVTPSGTKIAHTVNDLAGWAGVPSEALASILQRLAGPEARVLRAAALNTPDGETRYEITHDILAPAILDWVRLRSAERLRAEAERQRRLARNLKGLTIGVSVSALVCVMIATLAFIEFLRERQSARDNQHAALEIKRLTAERDQIIASAKPPLTSRRYDLEFTETAAPPRESPRVSAGAKGTTQPSKKPDPPGSSQIVPADAAVVRSDKVPSIAIVSQTTNVGAEDLNQVAAALQIQVQRDLIPKWGIDAKIRSYQKLVDVPLDAWPVLLKDASGAVSGAYHSVRNGVPFALVVFSEDWTLDMSHQILEILVDSLGNRFTTAPSIDPDDKGALVQYLVQICDPVEDARFSYEIHGVKVSDFVLPAFYDSAAISGPFSFTVRPARPLQVLPGGYISFRNPATDEWKQVIVNADGKSQIRKLGKISK